eukprot:gene40826-50519_t
MDELSHREIEWAFEIAALEKEVVRMQSELDSKASCDDETDVATLEECCVQSLIKAELKDCEAEHTKQLQQFEAAIETHELHASWYELNTEALLLREANDQIEDRDALIQNQQDQIESQCREICALKQSVSSHVLDCEESVRLAGDAVRLHHDKVVALREELASQTVEYHDEVNNLRCEIGQLKEERAGLAVRDEEKTRSLVGYEQKISELRSCAEAIQAEAMALESHVTILERQVEWYDREYPVLLEDFNELTSRHKMSESTHAMQQNDDALHSTDCNEVKNHVTELVYFGMITTSEKAEMAAEVAFLKEQLVEKQDDMDLATEAHVKLMLNKVSLLQEQGKKDSDIIASLNVKLKHSQAENVELQARVDADQVRKLEEDAMFSSLFDSYQALSDHEEKLCYQIATLEGENKELQAECDRLSASLTAQDGESFADREMHSMTVQWMVQGQERLAEMTAEIATLKALLDCKQFEVDQAETQTKVLQEQTTDAADSVAALTLKCDWQSVAIENLTSSRDVAIQALCESQSEIVTLQIRIHALETKLNECDAGFSRLSEDHQAAMDTERQLRSQVVSLEAANGNDVEIATLKEQLAEKQLEVDLMKSRINDLQQKSKVDADSIVSLTAQCNTTTCE